MLLRRSLRPRPPPRNRPTAREQLQASARCCPARDRRRPEGPPPRRPRPRPRQAPILVAGGQEERCQRDDEDQTRHDERDAADQRADVAAQAPSAVDRQLRRGRPREQVGHDDAVLELLGVQPPAPLDAQIAQHHDVRRRPAEAQAADAPHSRRTSRRLGGSTASAVALPGVAVGFTPATVRAHVVAVLLSPAGRGSIPAAGTDAELRLHRGARGDNSDLESALPAPAFSSMAAIAALALPPAHLKHQAPLTASR